MGWKWRSLEKAADQNTPRSSIALPFIRASGLIGNGPEPAHNSVDVPREVTIQSLHRTPRRRGEGAWTAHHSDALSRKDECSCRDSWRTSVHTWPLTSNTNIILILTVLLGSTAHKFPGSFWGSPDPPTRERPSTKIINIWLLASQDGFFQDDGQDSGRMLRPTAAVRLHSGAPVGPASGGADRSLLLEANHALSWRSAGLKKFIAA